jgi:hypothetical protein
MLAGLALVLLGAAPAHADEVVGTLAVNGRAEATALSDVFLQPGVTYRIEVTGTSTVSAGDASSQYDALYCFASSSDQCASPFREPGAFGIGLQTGGSPPPTEDLADFAGVAYPAYSAGHTYSVSYTPSVAGRLYLRGWPGSFADDGVSRSGSFTVTIRGPSGSGCPAANQDTNDQGTCDWRASWSIGLDYAPRRGEQADDVKRVQIRAKGDILFDRKLQTGKTATGEPSGHFVFIIRLRADPNVNNGNPGSLTVRMELVNARVRYTRSARNLDFDARVLKATGTVNNLCDRGQSVAIRAVQRGGRGKDEIFLQDTGGRCLGFSGSGDALKVELDRPVRL